MGSTFVQKIAEIEQCISRGQVLNKSLKNKNQELKPIFPNHIFKQFLMLKDIADSHYDFFFFT